MRCPSPRRCGPRSGASSCRTRRRWSPAAADGHRTVPARRRAGLGKTAQALLAAEAAGAYPLLVVVPNVVKTNWARETGLWTPQPQATVVHGDGDTVDAFSDVVSSTTRCWTGTSAGSGSMGFRGMVVDEAHFIKNKGSQRSRHVLELSERIRRARCGRC
jgi:SNF2 family DNA or RNA helicase